MKGLILLAVLLVGSLAVFVDRGLDAFAARDTAHEDLLQRERKLETLVRTVGPTDDSAFAALDEDHSRLTGLVRQRLALMAAMPDGQAPRARLDALLRTTSCEALRPGGALHAGVRAQAGLPADEKQDVPAQPTLQEQALARIVEALSAAGGALDLETLELRGGGKPVAIADAPGLQSIEAQLVVSGALPHVLAVLEAFAPGDGGGLPALTVRDAAVRRIDPSRWGENVHRLPSPPLRLTASLDVLVSAQGGS